MNERRRIKEKQKTTMFLFKEILDTEKNYVASLEYVVKGYLYPMTKYATNTVAATGLSRRPVVTAKEIQVSTRVRAPVRACACACVHSCVRLCVCVRAFFCVAVRHVCPATTRTPHPASFLYASDEALTCRATTLRAPHHHRRRRHHHHQQQQQ